MRDVLVLLLIAAFFAVCIAYVWWCDRIIGPDPVDLPDALDAPEFVSPISPVAGAFGDTNRKEARGG
jgi:hypothetical protein